MHDQFGPNLPMQWRPLQLLVSYIDPIPGHCRTWREARIRIIRVSQWMGSARTWAKPARRRKLVATGLRLDFPATQHQEVAECWVPLGRFRVLTRRVLLVLSEADVQ